MSELDDAARAYIRADTTRDRAWDRLRLAVIAEKELRNTSEVQLAHRAGVNRQTIRKWLAEHRGER